MYRVAFHDLGVALERNLEKCRKCFTPARFEDRCENYGYIKTIYIRCEKCDRQLDADVGHFDSWEDKYKLCKILAITWNTENNLDILHTPSFEPPSFNISTILSLTR